MVGLICHTKDGVGAVQRCTVHKGWGLGELLVVPGAAILATAVGCSLVLELEDPCLSRELQTWATAVGCSSGTCGWKFLRREGSNREPVKMV